MSTRNGCTLDLLAESLEFIGCLGTLSEHIHPRRPVLIVRLNTQARDEFIGGRRGRLSVQPRKAGRRFFDR